MPFIFGAVASPLPLKVVGVDFTTPCVLPSSAPFLKALSAPSYTALYFPSTLKNPVRLTAPYLERLLIRRSNSPKPRVTAFFVRVFRMRGILNLEKSPLTTPPCTEGVRWIVMKTPLVAEQNQIDDLEERLGDSNNRPPQPLNARLVFK